MQSQMWFFLAILMVSVFSFTSVAVWTENRRKEREAYYKSESVRHRSEALQRIATQPGESTELVLKMMREEERIRLEEERAKDRKRMEGMKVGGMINIGVGLGLMGFFYGIGGRESPFLCGLIPAFIGVALLVYVLWLAPKPQAA